MENVFAPGSSIEILRMIVLLCLNAQYCNFSIFNLVNVFVLGVYFNRQKENVSLSLHSAQMVRFLLIVNVLSAISMQFIRTSHVFANKTFMVMVYPVISVILHAVTALVLCRMNALDVEIVL